MQILLFHPDKETREMIGFCLESQMGLEVYRAASCQEALDFFLDDTVIDLIITGSHDETNKLFKYLLSTGAKIPVVMVHSAGEDSKDLYPEIQVIARLQENEAPEKLGPIIRGHFKDLAANSHSADYCRISTELLVRVVPLRGDIYIRLSNVKFVKLFRTGMLFSSEDLEKFLVRRKVSFLYIKKEDTQEFVSKFKDDLAALVKSATPGDPELFTTVVEVQALIQELSDRLGFTSEVQELARDNIQLTLKAIGSSPKLTLAFAGTAMKSKNYISSHSVMLANISCSIAAQMEWPSNTTFHKLVLASLFHDIAFQDPVLAGVSTKAELEALKAAGDHKLSDENYNLIKSHPQRASEVIKGLNEVPGDVDFVVLQHHERPDGSGFPKGLRGPQIPPLSAVFIFSHDMLDAMINEGAAFDLMVYLKRVEAQNQVGAFKKIWRTLAIAEAKKPVPDSGSGAAA